MQFDILSLFPHILDEYYNSSILGRAQKDKKIIVTNYDLRNWAINKHRQVDDTPYGGGPGMVIRVDVVHAAIQAIYKRKRKDTRVVLLSPRGETYSQAHAERLSQYKRIILIAGRYEAIDARIDHYIDEKISLGNFVLTGGELAAAAIVDSVSRLVPGVLGDEASLNYESFSEIKKGKTIIEHPHYTKPESYDGKKVPEVLLSGDHAKIEEWRKKNSREKKV